MNQLHQSGSVCSSSGHWSYFYVLFIIVEKRIKLPLVNLKLAFHPVIFTGNIMMLMFGILQYFVITGIPRLGSAPAPSGLGLDPIK